MSYLWYTKPFFYLFVSRIMVQFISKQIDMIVKFKFLSSSSRELGGEFKSREC